MAGIKHYILIAAAAVIALAGIVMVACSPRADSKPMISVSIPPQKYIVEQITGDKMEVRALLTQGANPESYEPSMSHLMNLEKSQAYLRMGNLGFEDAIIGKVKNSNPNLQIIDISEGIDLITGTHSHHHIDGVGDSDHESHHHDADEPDPHTWSSVANARLLAQNTLKAVSNLDPANTDYYTANYNTFMERLDSLDTAIRGILKDAPSSSFIVWHPSLSYFARDYGLTQISIGAENKELSARNLRDKIDTARANQGLVLLLQRDFDTSRAEAVNKEIGAHIIYIDPLSPDWPGELLHTARAIAGKE